MKYREILNQFLFVKEKGLFVDEPVKILHYNLLEFFTKMLISVFFSLTLIFRVCALV